MLPVEVTFRTDPKTQKNTTEREALGNFQEEKLLEKDMCVQKKEEHKKLNSPVGLFMMCIKDSKLGMEVLEEVRGVGRDLGDGGAGGDAGDGGAGGDAGDGGAGEPMRISMMWTSSRHTWTSRPWCCNLACPEGRGPVETTVLSEKAHQHRLLEHSDSEDQNDFALLRMTTRSKPSVILDETPKVKRKAEGPGSRHNWPA